VSSRLLSFLYEYCRTWLQIHRFRHQRLLYLGMSPTIYQDQSYKFRDPCQSSNLQLVYSQASCRQYQRFRSASRRLSQSSTLLKNDTAEISSRLLLTTPPVYTAPDL